ncbi:hypothetical protein [Kutzneria chonburiensis]|uniref:Uncharacterized protein n=1 Tax=Kutzneria chonburiensis TaxID=1483604 RepID=A0ABV6MQZ9_9PSEU|nr:hypothetical protein [Kutzneria chonburiensis]
MRAAAGVMALIGAAIGLLLTPVELVLLLRLTRDLVPAVLTAGMLMTALAQLVLYGLGGVGLLARKRFGPPTAIGGCCAAVAWIAFRVVDAVVLDSGIGPLLIFVYCVGLPALAVLALTIVSRERSVVEPATAPIPMSIPASISGPASVETPRRSFDAPPPADDQTALVRMFAGCAAVAAVIGVVGIIAAFAPVSTDFQLPSVPGMPQRSGPTNQTGPPSGLPSVPSTVPTFPSLPSDFPSLPSFPTFPTAG